MKYPILTFVMALLSCQDNQNRCIDSSRKTDGVCYEVYKPVCGCDGKTYSNDCFAKAAGAISWTEGKCE